MKRENEAGNVRHKFEREKEMKACDQNRAGRDCKVNISRPWYYGIDYKEVKPLLQQQLYQQILEVILLDTHVLMKTIKIEKATNTV